MHLSGPSNLSHLRQSVQFVKALNSDSRMLWRSYLEKRCAEFLPGPTLSSANGIISDTHRSLIESLGRRDDGYHALKAAGWSYIKRPDQAWLEERVEVVRILLDSRAPLDTQDVCLISALSCHCSQGLIELVELMLERGVDAPAVGHGGATPLLVTCGSRFISFENTRAVIQPPIDARS